MKAADILRKLFPRSAHEERANVREAIGRENLRRIYDDPPFVRRLGDYSAREVRQFRAHRLDGDPEDFLDVVLRGRVAELMAQKGAPATTIVDSIGSG